MASINANIHFGPLPSYTAVGSRCVAPKRYLIKQIKNNYIVTNNQLTLRMPCTFNVFCLMSIYTVASSLHSVSKKGIVLTSKCLFLCACIINSAWTEYHQSKKKNQKHSHSHSLWNSMQRWLWSEMGIIVKLNLPYPFTSQKMILMHKYH